MIIAAYKPKGITSHDVVDIVRKKFGVRKVGHAGTLDPMAEGVLIVLVGDDTKRQKEFMGLEKEYIAEIVLGVQTDTYDIEGKITSRQIISRPFGSKIFDPKGRSEIKYTTDEIQAVLKQFIGETEQEVPPYSAVKIKGKPLYKYAREGKMMGITLPKRKVFIKEIELLEIGIFRKEGFVGGKYPFIKIRVVCSKGTYIRSLANDIGKNLGCGGVLTALVRTSIGDYKLDKCTKLEDL